MAEVEDKQNQSLNTADSPTEVLAADNNVGTVGDKSGNHANTQTQNGGTGNNSSVGDELSDTSEVSSLSDSDRNKLPKVNCPEKIVSKP